MSITGAVTELNKEIDRLTKLRDALLEGSSETNPVHAAAAASTRKPRVAKRAATAAKSVAVKKSSPSKKRTLSAAGRKRISDAAKARWAAKKKADNGK
jgi:transposase